MAVGDATSKESPTVTGVLLFNPRYRLVGASQRHCVISGSGTRVTWTGVVPVCQSKCTWWELSTAQGDSEQCFTWDSMTTGMGSPTSIPS